MQFDTMLAYNELLASKPWTADLAAIAKDHELPLSCPNAPTLGEWPILPYAAPQMLSN
jgi:hypothetical protein